ncbi:MAG: histidine kinase [Bacteroidales bacterium]|nr:histidine kinase [Candidatus Latescibacterota bacterium]
MSFSQDQIILINLLLRIAVMAGITSLLLGFRSVTSQLAEGTVDRRSRVKLFILLALFFSMGIAVRKLSSQAAMDLSLEGALVAGFLGGAWVGAGTGFIIGLACYFCGEVVALPLYTVAGASAGLVFSWLRRGGEIWSYSLNPFLIVYNFLEKLVRGRLDRNFIPFAFCMGFALLRYGLLNRFYHRGWIYGYPTRDWFFITIDLIVLVYTVGIALKMVTSARTEEIMREEENQLIHARLTTLRSQINPHFLFNTLNSISALIRTDSEKAREMTRKLSSIFRKSLEETSDTHTLREEIGFLEDYLSIEKIRFGDEKLVIEKDLDPSTLDCQVPTLLLQPLVENAVKHGISCMTCGGKIRISSKRSKKGFNIEVVNDGPEMDDMEATELIGKGVGLKNVSERLRIYSRGEGSFEIVPLEGGGASVRLSIPHIG